LLSHRSKPGESKKMGASEIAWWNSKDGGKTFSKGEVLLSQTKGFLIFTSLILNAHPDARIIVAKKNAISDFSLVSLSGDHGLIKRPEAEANQLSESDKAMKKISKKKK
jgi:hypothetical protein